MKKLNIVCVFLLIFLTSVVSVNAYTAYLAVGNGLDYDLLDGIDVFVDIADPINNLTLNVYYQSGVDLNAAPHGFTGAVPDNLELPLPIGTIMSWDIFLTNYGANAASELDIPLSLGMVLSLTSASEFNLSDIKLLSDVSPSGFYNLPYSIIEEDFLSGKLYTTTAVPIPPAILLFASGLVGIVGLRRKK